MKQSKVYPSLVLGCICLSVALLLSVINMFTAPVIADRQNALADAAKTEVLPGGSNFKDITADFEFPASISEAYSADGGFVFRSTGKGRNGDIVIMVGVNTEGQITGTKIISEAESKGYKEKIYTLVEGVDGQYSGQTLEAFAPIIASGATMTSNGFADAVKAALQAYVIANGGSVDTRTPEQILQDNCNAALGTTEVEFTRWFATEELVGIDKAYVSDSGFVFIIGETFIGVNATGVTTADVSAEDAEKALAAYALASGSTLTEITVPDGANKTLVKKAYTTASGNYVFELEAAGYDVMFEYSNGNMAGTPKPITIKISISAEGKIIDCATIDHAETAGFGDACAKDDYRDSWVGAGNSDVVVVPGTPDHHTDLVPDGSTDLGAISSATYTTQGYQKAVKAAFGAFELLTATEGGND